MSSEKATPLRMADIRVVMLGFRNGGKSSVGNTILGQQLFQSKKTVQHIREQGQVAGRQVTIVKAPGWGEKQSLQDTSELMREQIILSASLGPHAVLLVIRTGMRFTEINRRAVQEHVELLGGAVWSHTIVMFTHGEWLGGSSIERYIESEGKPLQWVVEKCGNRYHVFRNDDRGGGGQVTELFAKIDETTGSPAHHYQIEGSLLKAVKEKIKKEEGFAELMSLRAQKGFQMAAGVDSHPGTHTEGTKPAHGPGDEAKPGTVTQTYKKTLKIVLLGQLDAGKSLLGNSLLGGNEFCSENAVQSVRKELKVSGREIIVVNTPGWGREQRLSDTPEFIKEEIMLSISQCTPGPHVLFLVVRVDTPFTELHRSAVQDHMDLLGPDVWKHTVLLLSSGPEPGDVSIDIEKCREQGGKPLKWLMGKCENRCAVLGLKSSSPLKEPLEIADRLVSENNGSHYKMDNILQQVEDRRTERKNKVVQKMDELGKRLEETKIRDESESCTSTNMRVILLGYRGAGKTAAARIILGEDNLLPRQSVESVKAKAHISGRHVSVVRASDWSREQPLTDTAELTKQEITLSLTLCPPGPHSILIVLNLRLKFSEASRRAVQEHLELLTEDAWRYSMVLFTCEEDLEDGTTDQYIESEGKPLHWLIERCGYRYHVLNTKSRDERQLRELLNKIDSIATDDNVYFKPGIVMLSKVENQRKKESMRAEARISAVQKQRQELQAKLKQVMS